MGEYRLWTVDSGLYFGESEMMAKGRNASQHHNITTTGRQKWAVRG
jgi:hypothetical protein